MAKFEENGILLVNPTGGWDTRMDEHYFYPVGLLYLQNYLRKHGIPSRIIDVRPLELSPESFKGLINEARPKIIGFTGSPFERKALFEYISGVKAAAPGALVLAGGPFFTVTAQECLERLPDVDIVVRGEGERTLLEIAQAYGDAKRLSGIKGITYRDASGKAVANPSREFMNRDDAELDVGLLRNDDIYTPFVDFKNYEEQNLKALPVLIARGCTERCVFCFNNNYGRFRSRSVDSVIGEIRRKREMFESDVFWMVDPTFTLREEYALALCEGIRKSCPGIRWYCETRADCSLPLLEKMAGAGCASIDFALESGSPKVLKAIRKRLDLSKLKDFARRTSELGIRSLAFVLYSLPEETFQDFLMTMDVLNDIKPFIHTISHNGALILPGTQMEAMAKERGIIPAGFQWYDGKPGIPLWRGDMSEEEANRCWQMLEDFKCGLAARRDV